MINNNISNLNILFFKNLNCEFNSFLTYDIKSIKQPIIKYKVNLFCIFGKSKDNNDEDKEENIYLYIIKILLRYIKINKKKYIL
jgi:hypothetical protein